MNNIENVIRWLELNNLEFWTVSRNRGSNSKVFESLEDETLPDRKQRFRDTMKLQPASFYIVSAKRQKNQTAGLFETEFKNDSGVGAEPAPVQSSGPAVISGIPKEEVSAMIAKAIEDDRIKRELEDLRKENRELKKEVDENGGAMARVLKRAEPVIGMILEKVVPQRPTVQVAGIEREETDATEEVTDDELTDRVQRAVELWQSADEDFITVLEFISNFAASGDKIDAGFMKLDYQTVKGMLLK